MSNVNDDRILKIREQIKSKKEEISKINPFKPITNCRLSFEENTNQYLSNLISLKGVYNIRAMNKNTIMPILILLNSIRLSALDLGVLDDCKINDFNIQDWITDLNAWLENIKLKEYEKDLKAKEDMLMKLLSNDKQIELQLDEIENGLL